MDLLAGYDSDEDGNSQMTDTKGASTTAASSISTRVASDAEGNFQSSHTTTAEAASPQPQTHSHTAATQQTSTNTNAAPPDTDTPPSEVPNEEEERARKRQKKEEKKKKKEQKAAAAAATQEPTKPRLVLPSASQLLKGLNATALGLNAPPVVDEDAASKPVIDMSKKYNALPPPTSLLQADQGTEEEQWKMKPMNFTEKKRKFTDMPAVTSSSHAGAASSTHSDSASTPSTFAATAAPKPTSSSTSASSPASTAAPASTLPTSTLRRFAPPQLVRKQANVSTEDIGNWNTASKSK